MVYVTGGQDIQSGKKKGCKDDCKTEGNDVLDVKFMNYTENIIILINPDLKTVCVICN